MKAAIGLLSANMTDRRAGELDETVSNTSPSRRLVPREADGGVSGGVRADGGVRDISRGRRLEPRRGSDCLKEAASSVQRRIPSAQLRKSSASSGGHVSSVWSGLPGSSLHGHRSDSVWGGGASLVPKTHLQTCMREQYHRFFLRLSRHACGHVYGHVRCTYLSESEQG